MKILLIEDEVAIADSLADFLAKEGYVCEWCGTFALAREKILLYEYNVVLLDIGLPDCSGMELLPLIKAKKPVPGIIILSARNALGDRVEGLEGGADDYLTKPFHLSELNARLKSLIRRVNFQGNNLISFNELEIYPDELRVKVKEQELILTKKEFDLLIYFLANKNRIVTKVSISEHLWGDYMDMADSYDFIYTHIKNLRKKLLKAGAADYIKNVYGVGYKFET
ncbi:MAG: hypothetical protein RIS47_86 [Bacteroidota bacterium]